MTHARLVTDRQLVEEMRRCMWRDDARHAGVLEHDIERSAFVRWLLERRGGVAVVVSEPVKRVGRW